jgi:hypothetical protein
MGEFSHNFILSVSGRDIITWVLAMAVHCSLE